MIPGIFATAAIFFTWQGMLNQNRAMFWRAALNDKQTAKYTAIWLAFDGAALIAAFLSGVFTR
jgi:hypothetical protein